MLLNKMSNLDNFFERKEEGRNSPEYNNTVCSSFNYNQEYQYVIEKSKLLQKTEHIEIFKIINNNGDDYTSNENGVFIALNKLKPETVAE